MEPLTRKTYKTAPQAKPDIELAGEIYEWSGKKINFPRLLITIRKTGVRAVRELYIETKKQGATFPLLLYKLGLKENKTVFK